ncbi:MAG TPA: YceI family protein [Thermoanaerobaculia bacterium]|nr:YceI family protein [Thermoanaerobaculia bacterium]
MRVAMVLVHRAGRLLPHAVALLGLALGSSLSSSARAEAYTYRLEPAATAIRFVVGATMHKVRGTAALERGEIRFDGQTGAAEGEVVIDAASLETGNAKRDRDMHEAVLESAEFPEIVLVVVGFEGDFDPAAPSDVVVDARLRIHGGEHPLRLEARLEPRDGRLAATTTFVVPYVEWGMENPSRLLLRVGKEVTVTIEAQGALTREGTAGAEAR